MYVEFHFHNIEEKNDIISATEWVWDSLTPVLLKPGQKPGHPGSSPREMSILSLMTWGGRLPNTHSRIHTLMNERKQAMLGQEDWSVGYHTKQNRDSLYCFLLFLAEASPVLVLCSVSTWIQTRSPWAPQHPPIFIRELDSQPLNVLTGIHSRFK